MEKFNKMAIKDYQECKVYIRPVRDVIDMIGSKWKLPILVALGFKDHRFNELERQIQGITPRMLSRELKDLEFNKLVKRVVSCPDDNIVKYGLTEEGKSLEQVITAMRIWGTDYRKKIMKKNDFELR